MQRAQGSFCEHVLPGERPPPGKIHRATVPAQNSYLTIKFTCFISNSASCTSFPPWLADRRPFWHHNLLQSGHSSLLLKAGRFGHSRSLLLLQWIESSVHASPTVRDSALDSDLGLGGWTTLASWLLPSLESCIPTGVKTQTYSGVQNLTLQWPTEPLAWVGKIQATSLSVRHRS